MDDDGAGRPVGCCTLGREEAVEEEGQLCLLFYAFDETCLGMGGLRILGKSWGPDWRKNCLSCTVCGGVKCGGNSGMQGDIKVLSVLYDPSSQKFR